MALALACVLGIGVSAAVGRAAGAHYSGTVQTLSGAVSYDAADEDGDGLPETVLVTYGEPPVPLSVHVVPGTEVLVGGALVVFGTDGDDEIDEGGSLAPLIGFLGRGDDTVHGGLAGDALYGGPGADSLYGGAGDDELHGGPDADHLYGEADDDVLLGNGGDDTLDGGPGIDQVEGMSGDDIERGGE